MQRDFRKKAIDFLCVNCRLLENLANEIQHITEEFPNNQVDSSTSDEGYIVFKKYHEVREIWIKLLINPFAWLFNEEEVENDSSYQEQAVVTTIL